MILTIMQFPPSSEGHGGSQRAWYTLSALIKVAPVHLVLIYPSTYRQAANANLEPVQALVQSLTRIAVREWSASWHVFPHMPRRIGRWLDVARMGSQHTPKFSRQTLLSIAAQLPITSPDLIFAARLPAAIITEDLINHGLINSRVKVVDFDDVQSRFQQREVEAERRPPALDKFLIDRLLLSKTKKAELRIAASWDAVSVCSDEDVSVIREAQRKAHVFRVPNVIDKPLLPYFHEKKPFTLLFVGNLSFGPNSHGLQLFIEKAWPFVRREVPSIRMQVVGLNPSTSLRDVIQNGNVELHANVPSVEPYYLHADLVIVPIMFGSGTRVKILEAMAFGRPVVSTTIGAEGLNVEHGKHLIIADTMSDFAAAIVRLASDLELRMQLIRNGRALQQEQFGPLAMDNAVRTMLAESGCAAI